MRIFDGKDYLKFDNYVPIQIITLSYNLVLNFKNNNLK